MFRLTDPAGGLKAPVLGSTFGNTGPLALSLALQEFSVDRFLVQTVAQEEVLIRPPG